MKLYLMRHAHATEGARSDPHRTIDSVGKDQLEAMRKFFKWADVAPDIIICSPFARGRDTAEYMRRGDTPIKIAPALAPADQVMDCDPSAALKQVRSIAGDAKDVLVIGHGPLIELMLAAVAFAIEPSVFHFEHGSCIYINTDESRLRWIVTPKLAAHVVGHDPKEVENPPVFAEAAIALTENLNRAHKAKLIDPLVVKLSAALRARWARQWKKLKRDGLPLLADSLAARSNPPLGPVLAAARYHDKVFARTYAKVTAAAYQGGAIHAQGQLGLLEEAAPKKKLPGNLPGPPDDAEGLEGSLDDTTDDQVTTSIENGFASGLTHAAIVAGVAAVFAGFGKSEADTTTRADTVALGVVSDVYHQGAADLVDSFEADGGDAEKTWDAEDDACEDCLGNEAQGWIDADDTFESGDDEPPAHPNCRCSVSYRSVASSVLGVR